MTIALRLVLFEWFILKKNGHKFAYGLGYAAKTIYGNISQQSRCEKAIV